MYPQAGSNDGCSSPWTGLRIRWALQGQKDRGDGEVGEQVGRLSQACIRILRYSWRKGNRKRALDYGGGEMSSALPHGAAPTATNGRSVNPFLCESTRCIHECPPHGAYSQNWEKRSPIVLVSKLRGKADNLLTNIPFLLSFGSTEIM